MLIVPFGFDQFDNAERAERLGIAKSLNKSLYSVANAAPLIAQLATDPNYTQRAAAVGSAENNSLGIALACDVVELVLNNEH